MSTEAFENFYFDVCANLDYERMSKAMTPLVERMMKTDRVRIVAPAQISPSRSRVYRPSSATASATSRRRDLYRPGQGLGERGHRLQRAHDLPGGAVRQRAAGVQDGRSSNASSSDTARMNQFLDTDEAPLRGEFAIGVQPVHHNPMKDALFDEKIAGSIHFHAGGGLRDLRQR